MNDRVTVGKGTAATVFTGQAHAVTTGYQRRECHVLAHAPVHINVTPTHGRTVFIHLGNQGMRRHGGRNGGQALRQTLPLGHWHGGVGRVAVLFVDKRRPVDRVFVLEVGDRQLFHVLAGIHGGAVGLGHVVTQGLTQALRCQLFSVQLARAGVSTDLLVHQRLRQAWGVLLVVAQFAEANDVQHHVVVELLTVFQRQAGRQNHGFRIITIHVQHG